VPFTRKILSLQINGIILKYHGTFLLFPKENSRVNFEKEIRHIGLSFNFPFLGV